jgi:integral membrane protein
MTSMRTMRIVALLEATSFLALLVATFIKYSDDAPGGVQILGPIHGVLFLAYVFLALNLRASAGWDNRTTVLVLLGAVLPFGGFVVDRTLLAPAERRAV